jgi:hypothetical protein
MRRLYHAQLPYLRAQRENRRMGALLGLVVDVDAENPTGEVSRDTRRAIG